MAGLTQHKMFLKPKSTVYKPIQILTSPGVKAQYCASHSLPELKSRNKAAEPGSKYVQATRRWVDIQRSVKGYFLEKSIPQEKFASVIADSVPAMMDWHAYSKGTPDFSLMTTELFTNKWGTKKTGFYCAMTPAVRSDVIFQFSVKSKKNNRN